MGMKIMISDIHPYTLLFHYSAFNGETTMKNVQTTGIEPL